VKIARICILREDLLLEMQGYMAEEIKALDEHSPEFRRTYFVRSMVRTQMELAGAISRLLADAHFKTLLEKQPAEIKMQFADGQDLIARSKPVAKDMRDDICGHVQEKAVREALEDIHHDVFGLMDMAPMAANPHYKFAAELVSAIMLKRIPEEELRAFTSSKFATLAEMLKLFRLIEHSLVIYATDKGLVPEQ